MSDRSAAERAACFASDLHAWTALHHFLPTALLRELAAATVSVLAPGGSLADLFDEHLSGEGVTAVWSVVPKRVDGHMLRYLRDHIRSLVWANDGDTYPFSLEGQALKTEAAQLSSAVRLGRFDFGAMPIALQRLDLPAQSSARVLAETLADVIASVETGASMLETVSGRLRQLAAPLHTLFFKHVGDLFADADAWEEARRFYNAAAAAAAAGDVDSAVWEDLLQPFCDLVRQSQAVAAWMIEGPQAAIEPLRALADASDRSPRRLGVLNGSHDALVARLAAHQRDDVSDLRSAVLKPPLLTTSFDEGAAMHAWQHGRFEDAYRLFWSVLRRQVALGSMSDAGDTRSLYGRALLGEVLGLEEEAFRPGQFELGVRLLTEAARPKGLDTLKFTKSVVERYVTPALITELENCTEKQKGVRHLRSLVLVELLSKWGEAAPAEAEPLTGSIMRALIARTQAFDAAFDSSYNVGGRGLKLLRDLAEKRPELRRAHGSEIADLIADMLERQAWWTGTAEAFELALRYVDVLQASDLRRVLVSGLTALRKIGPEAGMTPVVQPAMQLLLSKPALDLAGADTHLGPGYVSTLIRFGVAERYAGITLLFALGRFHQSVLLEPGDGQLLNKIVEEARAGGRDLASSSAVDFNRALIVGASYAGEEAVTEALGNMMTILRSVDDQRTSIAFPYSYQAILDFVERWDGTQDQERSSSRSTSIVAEFTDALRTAWRGINDRPALLARFTIPIEDFPHPTIAYNWALATRRFMERCGSDPELERLLARAQETPALADSLARAEAAAAPPDRLEPGELDAIAVERSELFYAAVGRRLRIADRLIGPARIALLQRLVDRCLQIGPDPLDLAIFMAASPAREQLRLGPAASDYRSKLRGNKRLNANLSPYLNYEASFPAPAP